MTCKGNTDKSLITYSFNVGKTASMDLDGVLSER